MSIEKHGQKEQTSVDTAFGSVTDKQVVYFRAKGWFSGGSREDVPLRQITSVRVDITRHIIAGIIFGLIGLGILSAGEPELAIFGMILIILAGLLLWGSPSVVVNTAGCDLSAARGFPWQRKEANTFVDALRKQLFRE